MSLLEQELLSHREHMSARLSFSDVHVARYFALCVVFFLSLFVFVLFLLAVVLSIRRFTASDHHLTS